MLNKIDNRLPGFLIDPEYRLYRHLVLQSVIFLITINVFWDTPDELIGNRVGIWVCYFLLINAMVYFNIYVLVPRLLLKDKVLLYIISAFAVVFGVIVCIVIMQSFISDTIPEQPEVVSIFRSLLGITASVLSMSLLLAGISAFLLFRYWIKHNQRINELESSTLQSELKFLKSQINPHFLFNMLNNANIMVYEDPRIASRILIKLDDLLQYQMNDSVKESVSLKADIDFLTDFLELEKTRRDEFNYVITIDGDINDIQLPPLLFIPFVENAVKHNSDSEKESYVHIDFKLEKGLLSFVCVNSKPKAITKKEVGGLGLANIRRRLDLLFGKDYLLELKDEEANYTVNLQLKI